MKTRYKIYVYLIRYFWIIVAVVQGAIAFVVLSALNKVMIMFDMGGISVFARVIVSILLSLFYLIMIIRIDREEVEVPEEFKELWEGER